MKVFSKIIQLWCLLFFGQLKKKKLWNTLYINSDRLGFFCYHTHKSYVMLLVTPTSQMLCYLSHPQVKCFFKIIFWQICVVVGCWLAVGKTSSTRAAAASAASTSCRPTSSEISGTNSLDCRRSKGSTKMQFPPRFKIRFLISFWRRKL